VSRARLAPASALAVATLAGIAGIVLSYRVATAGYINIVSKWRLFDQISIWWVVFAIGLACVLRAPRRPALALIIVLAVGMRVAALASGPVVSDDIYRYAWDGHIQAAGINPYRYAPLSPRLNGLRDPWLWPNATGCAALQKQPGCTRINRPAERTIYPPVAEAWFRAGYAVVGLGSRDRGWQGLGFAADIAVMAVLLALLRRWGRDPRWLALYAWSPIAVIEAVQDGHVDVLATFLILGALWCLRRRPGWGGALLGAATLTKLYPALLFPLLLKRRSPAAVAAFAGVLVAGYLPHVLAVGGKVLGYLPGYLNEEAYLSGGRFQLLHLIGLSGAAAEIAAILILVGIAVAVLRARDVEPEVSSRWLLGGTLLVTTPVQPWYALALVAVAALDGAWWWLGVAAAGYPIYFVVLLHGPQALPEEMAALAALLLIVIVGLARRQKPGLAARGGRGDHNLARWLTAPTSTSATRSPIE
jgi:Glycosyltransferase family 87